MQANTKVDFIFYSNKSPNSFKIELALLELAKTDNITFDNINIDIMKKENHSPEFIKINPNKKVPAIVDNNQLGADGKPLVIFESGAILIYLGQKFNRFLPNFKVDPVGNSDVIVWTVFQVANLGPNFGQFTHFSKFSPLVEEYSLVRFHNEVQRILKLTEERLSVVPYIGGNEYSIADMAFIGWLLYLNHAPLYNATKERFPNLFKWLALVNQRESVQTVSNTILESFKTFDPKALRALFTDDKDLINQDGPVGIEKVVLKYD